MHGAMKRWLTAIVVFTTVGCDPGTEVEDSGNAALITPVQEQACIAFENAICAEPSVCEEAIIADCTDVVGLLNGELVETAASCVESGAPFLECLPYSLGGLTPTDAHREFAAAFCAHCQPAPFVPECEEILVGTGQGTSEDSELVRIARSIVFAVGDDIVRDLTAECMTGLTCLAHFPSCATDVLIRRAMPEETALCLVSALIAGESLACGEL